MVEFRRNEGFFRYRYEYLAAVTATMSLVATVAAAGWSSPAIPALKQADSPIPITPDQGSWIVSILSIGSLFGPIITGFTIDRWGRKLVLLLSVIPLTIGWIMIVFASNIPIVYAARFLHGISYGMAYTITPIYLGEISSNAIRGSTGVLVTVMAKVAFLIEYSVGPYVSFQSLALISMTFPIFFITAFLWMPETPYFFLARGNDKAALKSLQWLRQTSSDELYLELHTMKALVQKSAQNSSPWKDLFTKANRRSLAMILLLSFGMQLTGINAILGYSQTIFAKLDMDLNAAELSIILGVVQLIAVFIPTFFVDKCGRRPLLLLSCTGSLFGLLCCACFFTLTAFQYSVEQYSWIPFVGALIFIIFFAFGLATVPFAILGEVFPKHIKACANALFAMISSVVVFTIIKLFQVISDGVGTYVSFWTFSVCTAITGLLIYVFIPETKGKSFEEIQQLITDKRKNTTKRAPLLC
ncbi:facilitated trehalose transporter Tret1-like [Uranotaenia lowii]|uniref:facilitated trehalose transporter Tret1-like n=1 Tax=Uranotaenia lowii TaxID=190385 RepID=UPI00247A2C94|nr:facilitated trehalose transporter Tret1-like [Uranotaenia lowii]